MKGLAHGMVVISRTASNCQSKVSFGLSKLTKLGSPVLLFNHFFFHCLSGFDNFGVLNSQNRSLVAVMGSSLEKKMSCLSRALIVRFLPWVFFYIDQPSSPVEGFHMRQILASFRGSFQKATLSFLSFTWM